MEDPRKHFKLYCQSFTRLATTIIIQSRQGQKFRTDTLPNNINAWYNLNIIPLSELETILKTSLGNKFLSDLPEINILSSLRTATGEKLDLEIWKFSVHPPPANVVCNELDFNPENLQTYYRLSIMLRSIMSASRATPAYKLYTRRQSADTFALGYNIVGSTLDPHFHLGEQFRTIDLGSVDGPLGSIKVCLYFRTKMIIGNDPAENLSTKSFRENYFFPDNLRQKQHVIRTPIEQVEENYAECVRGAVKNSDGSNATFHLGSVTPVGSLGELCDHHRPLEDISNQQSRTNARPHDQNRLKKNVTTDYDSPFPRLNTATTKSSISSGSLPSNTFGHVTVLQSDFRKRRSSDSFPFCRLLSPSFSAPAIRRSSGLNDLPKVSIQGLTVSHNTVQIRAPAARIMLQNAPMFKGPVHRLVAITAEKLNDSSKELAAEWKDDNNDIISSTRFYEGAGSLLTCSQSSSASSECSSYDMCETSSLNSLKFPIKFRASSRGTKEGDEYSSAESSKDKELLIECTQAPRLLKSFAPVFNCPGSFPDLRLTVRKISSPRSRSVASLASLARPAGTTTTPEEISISIVKIREELNFFEHNAKLFDDFVKKIATPEINEENEES